jgi:hypothetical protein
MADSPGSSNAKGPWRVAVRKRRHPRCPGADPSPATPGSAREPRPLPMVAERGRRLVCRREAATLAIPSDLNEPNDRRGSLVVHPPAAPGSASGGRCRCVGPTEPRVGSPSGVKLDVAGSLRIGTVRKRRARGRPTLFLGGGARLRDVRPRARVGVSRCVSLGRVRARGTAIAL